MKLTNSSSVVFKTVENFNVVSDQGSIMLDAFEYKHFLDK